MANGIKARLMAILPFLPFIILAVAVAVAVHYIMCS
jgi:hypothetical protein